MPIDTLRSCRVGLAALLLATCTTPALAQRLADLPAGATLRASAEGERGEVRAMDSQRTRHVLAGAAIGALVGVAVVIVDVAACNRRPNNDGECEIGYVFTPVVALAGSLIGGAIGALLPVDRPRAVELP